MSFNKKYISKDYDLKKEYKEVGHEAFVKRYSGYDCYAVGGPKNEYFLKQIVFKGEKYIPVWYEIKTTIHHNLKKIKTYVLRSKSKI